MQSSSSESNLGGGTRPNLKRRLDPISPNSKNRGGGKRDFDLRLSLQDPLLGNYNYIVHLDSTEFFLINNFYLIASYFLYHFVLVFMQCAPRKHDQ